MHFLIEFEGPIVDIAPVYHGVHREVAAEVGWSSLDQSTYWRTIRTQGLIADVLPGAKPAKLSAYLSRFASRVEQDDVVEQCLPQQDVDAALAAIKRHGSGNVITLGSNIDARQRVLEQHGLASYFPGTPSLNADPRRRPGELRALAGDDRRTVVAAANDALIRAAGEADLFAVGMTCGVSGARRLFQAGAALVYRDLDQLVESLKTGAVDMIEAGLLPAPLP